MSKKAFTLLEIILFLSISSILILALLQSVSLQNSLAQSQAFPLQKVTFCDTISDFCIFHSKVQESLHFYEVNATK